MSEFCAGERWGETCALMPLHLLLEWLGSRQEWKPDGPFLPPPNSWLNNCRVGKKKCPSQGSGHILSLHGIYVTSLPPLSISTPSAFAQCILTFPLLGLSGTLPPLDVLTPCLLDSEPLCILYSSF